MMLPFPLYDTIPSLLLLLMMLPFPLYDTIPSLLLLLMMLPFPSMIPYRHYFSYLWCFRFPSMIPHCCFLFFISPQEFQDEQRPYRCLRSLGGIGCPRIFRGRRRLRPIPRGKHVTQTPNFGVPRWRRRPRSCDSGTEKSTGNRTYIHCLALANRVPFTFRMTKAWISGKFLVPLLPSLSPFATRINKTTPQSYTICAAHVAPLLRRNYGILHSLMYTAEWKAPSGFRLARGRGGAGARGDRDCLPI